MGTLIVDIVLPRSEYLRVYESFIKDVRGVARNGQSIRFPVSVLKPFVTKDGVHGTFQLSFDKDHKFLRIDQLN